MAYKVLDVARYMIDSAARNGIPLSNLKLQKLIYFEWKEYYEQTGNRLFDDDFFHAWKFGPVVPSVYYEYYMFGAYPINKNLLRPMTNSPISEIDKDFIDKVLKKYKTTSVFQLVEKTHQKGCAWDRIFNGGVGNREIIGFKEIEDDVKYGRGE